MFVRRCVKGPVEQEGFVRGANVLVGLCTGAPVLGVASVWGRGGMGPWSCQNTLVAGRSKRFIQQRKSPNDGDLSVCSHIELS